MRVRQQFFRIPPAEHRLRPGKVAELRGIVFQNDGRSTIGRLFIRPVEAIDRWIAGVQPSPERPPLAMHAGLHVVLEDGREFVAEQLVGSLYMNLISGLSWTPLERFQARDRGGWDLTVPATAFRGVDDGIVELARSNLDSIRGHPFVGEDCTAFVERAFGGRRMFADSPLLSIVGLGVRVGDPALPLLKPDVLLDERAERLLHAPALRQLPNAVADPEAPNARLLVGRIASAALLGSLIGHLAARRRVW